MQLPCQQPPIQLLLAICICTGGICRSWRIPHAVELQQQGHCSLQPLQQRLWHITHDSQLLSPALSHCSTADGCAARAAVLSVAPELELAAVASWLIMTKFASGSFRSSSGLNKSVTFGVKRYMCTSLQLLQLQLWYNRQIPCATGRHN
jgi:hypothetical protein